MPRLKVRRIRNEVLVSICDDELLGKKFEEGELRLEINQTFYEGENARIKECLDALREATVANLVGSIVKHAIEAEYVSPERVIEIDGVLHAQMVRR